MKKYTLFVQETPTSELLETDTQICIDVLRSGGHWLARLINKGIIREGMGFQLRTKSRSFHGGRVVSSGIVCR